MPHLVSRSLSPHEKGRMRCVSFALCARTGVLSAISSVLGFVDGCEREVRLRNSWRTSYRSGGGPATCVPPAPLDPLFASTHSLFRSFLFVLHRRAKGGRIVRALGREGKPAVGKLHDARYTIWLVTIMVHTYLYFWHELDTPGRKN